MDESPVEGFIGWKPMEQDQLVKLYSDYRAIERDLHELSLFVDFTDNNAKTTSSVIRKITLSACAAIENVSKYIGKTNNGKRTSNAVSNNPQVKAMAELYRPDDV